MLRPFRKNHKRRFIVFFIAAVLAAGSAGCGKNPNPAPVKTTASVGAASQMTKSSGTARAVSQTAENGTEEIDAESLKPQEIELTYNADSIPKNMLCRDYAFGIPPKGWKDAPVSCACLDADGKNIYYVYNREDPDNDHEYAVKRKNIADGSDELLYHFRDDQASPLEVESIGCAGNCLMWNEGKNLEVTCLLVKFDLKTKIRTIAGTPQSFLFSFPEFSVVKNQFYWFGGVAGKYDQCTHFDLYRYDPATDEAARVKTDGEPYIGSFYDGDMYHEKIPDSNTSVCYRTKSEKEYFINDEVLGAKKRFRIKTGEPEITDYDADGAYAMWLDKTGGFYVLDLSRKKLYHYAVDKKNGTVRNFVFFGGKPYFEINGHLATVNFHTGAIVNLYHFDQTFYHGQLSAFTGGLYIYGDDKKGQNILKLFALDGR